MPNRILVIGYGSPDRVDDGVGVHAVERLKIENTEHPAVDIISARELRPEMIATAAAAELVIFISASTAGEPGAVREEEVCAEEEPGAGGLFAHELTPASLLRACNIMHKRVPAAMVILVAGENFGFGAQLSEAAEAALPQVVERIQALLRGTREPATQLQVLRKAG